MTVVQAHGCYAWLHMGHVLHLQAARKLGDRLVVTITGDAHLPPKRTRVHDEKERAHMLRALRCVDEVRIIEHPDAELAIGLVRPNIYVKGVEYMGRLKEEAFCERHGIKVVFLDSAWSSSNPKYHTSALLAR